MAPAREYDSACPRLGLVVEDQPEARGWLTQVLRDAFPELKAAEVGTRRTGLAWLAANKAALANTAADGRRHVALIDLGLPDGPGVDLIRTVVETCPGMIPIVTTIYDDDQHLFEAIAAGAQGYLLKDQPAETLVSYLHRIDRDEPPLSPSVARRMLDYFARRGAAHSKNGTVEALTAREMDVLRLLGRGLRISEAARVLGLTHHTVAGYVKTVYRKLNITSRAEAAVEAVRRGLV